jgi:hypothetical protein
LALLIGSSPITVEWQYVNTLILEGIIEVIHEKGTKLPAIVRIKAQQPSVSQPTSTIQPAILSPNLPTSVSTPEQEQQKV